jgi:glycerophosphoryl diester phosphodiesterase
MERRTWQETVEEKETVWRAHSDRLMQEIEAWKSAWEKREQEIQIQLETIHKAYRSVEGKWQARVTEIQQANLNKGRNEVIGQTDQAKAFRDRTADEMFNLENMAAEVGRRLVAGGKELKSPEVVQGKMKVFQEIREFVSHEMAEYAGHEGSSWSERTAIETAVLKALESGRYLLLNLQIELQVPVLLS